MSSSSTSSFFSTILSSFMSSPPSQTTALDKTSSLNVNEFDYLESDANDFLLIESPSIARFTVDEEQSNSNKKWTRRWAEVADGCAISSSSTSSSHTADLRNDPSISPDNNSQDNPETSIPVNS